MIPAALLVAVLAMPLPATPMPAPPLPVIPIVGAFVRPDSALDASGWARLPHATIEATDHDGKTGEYDGVGVAAVLRDAGSPIGDAVRGQAARAYLLVTASDGYTAIFTLAELETSETRCAPLLVGTRDHQPLPSGTGPVNVVAPCDRTHARWVHGVTKLTVIIVGDAPPH